MLALIEATSDSPAMVIALDGNQIVRKRLMDCVQKTLQVQCDMKEGNFAECINDRGRFVFVTK